MKKIECIIRSSKLEELVEEVEKLEISGLNITQIAGYGQQKGQQKETDVYRGVDYEIKLKEKLKIELVVEAEKVDSLIEGITTAARTGEVGDGKIFVYDIDKAVRIRTGEKNREVI